MWRETTMIRSVRRRSCAKVSALKQAFAVLLATLVMLTQAGVTVGDEPVAGSNEPVQASVLGSTPGDEQQNSEPVHPQQAGESSALTEPPVQTEAPVSTETPVPTEAPITTEAPVTTETPVSTEPPLPTEAPAPTETPQPGLPQDPSEPDPSLDPSPEPTLDPSLAPPAEAMDGMSLMMLGDPMGAQQVATLTPELTGSLGLSAWQFGDSNLDTYPFTVHVGGLPNQAEYAWRLSVEIGGIEYTGMNAEKVGSVTVILHVPGSHLNTVTSAGTHAVVAKITGKTPYVNAAELTLGTITFIKGTPTITGSGDTYNHVLGTSATKTFDVEVKRFALPYPDLRLAVGSQVIAYDGLNANIKGVRLREEMLAQLPVGPHPVTLGVIGDDRHNAVDPVTIGTVVVSKGTPLISGSGGPTTPYSYLAGSTATLNLTYNIRNVTPYFTAPLTLKIGGVVMVQRPGFTTDSSGISLTFSAAQLPPGKYDITLSSAATENYNAVPDTKIGELTVLPSGSGKAQPTASLVSITPAQWVLGATTAAEMAIRISYRNTANDNQPVHFTFHIGSTVVEADWTSMNSTITLRLPATSMQALGTGAHRVTMTATGNSANEAMPQTEVCTLNVYEMPTFITASLPSVVVGQPYSATVSAGGYPTPEIACNDQPSWLTVSASANGQVTLSGMPTSAGSYSAAFIAASDIPGMMSASKTIRFPITVQKARPTVAAGSTVFDWTVGSQGQVTFPITLAGNYGDIPLVLTVGGQSFPFTSGDALTLTAQQLDALPLGLHQEVTVSSPGNEGNEAIVAMALAYLSVTAQRSQPTITQTVTPHTWTTGTTSGSISISYTLTGNDGAIPLTLKVDGTAVGSGLTSAQNPISIDAAALNGIVPGGPYDITLESPGDLKNNPISAVVVGKLRAAKRTIVCPDVTVRYGQTATLAPHSIDGNGDILSGPDAPTYTFTSSDPSLVTVDANGVITLHDVSPLGTTVTIHSAATASYMAATDKVVYITIGRARPTVSGHDINGTVGAMGDQTLTVTISGTGNPPWGFLVQTKINGQYITISCSGDGPANLPIPASLLNTMAVGNYDIPFSIGANWYIDGNVSEVKVGTLHVNKYAPSLTGDNSQTAKGGAVGAKTVTATIQNAYFGAGSLTLTASLGGIAKTAQASANGVVTFDFTAAELNALPVARYPITVSFTGDANNKPAGADIGVLTVNATYRVIYHLNGGTGSPAGSYVYGVGLALPTPTRAGYAFGGWYDNANLTGSAVTAISDTETGDKAFWAKWTPDVYAVTYTLNGGSGSTRGSYVCGVGLTLPVPTRDGHTFGGWYGNANLTGSAVTAVSTTDIGDKVFWAKWTLDTYNIAYNLNGGSGSPTGSYTYGAGLALPIPTRNGFIFGGWYGDAAFSGDPVTAITVIDSGDKAFWAKWTAATYSITYHLNGGAVISPGSYTYGTGLVLPIPTRNGYAFGGWYDNANLTGSAVTAIASTDTGDKAFWAKWTANAASDSAGSTSGSSVLGASDDYEIALEIGPDGEMIVRIIVRDAPPPTESRTSSFTITDAMAKDAIEAIKAESRRLSLREPDIRVVIEFIAETPETGFDIRIKNAALARLQSAGVLSLDVVTDTFRFSLDAPAIEYLELNTSGDVLVPVRQWSNAPGGAQALIGSRPALTASIHYLRDKKPVAIPDFGDSGGTITMGIAYLPAPGEQPEELRAVTVDEAGETVTPPDSGYMDGWMTWRNGAPAAFGVGYGS